MKTRQQTAQLLLTLSSDLRHIQRVAEWNAGISVGYHNTQTEEARTLLRIAQDIRKDIDLITPFLPDYLQNSFRRIDRKEEAVNV